MKKIKLDTLIYKEQIIYKNINLFKDYVEIVIDSKKNGYVTLGFKGDSNEIYAKEFLNYLIILHSKGIS